MLRGWRAHYEYCVGTMYSRHLLVPGTGLKSHVDLNRFHFHESSNKHSKHLPLQVTVVLELTEVMKVPKSYWMIIHM